MVGDLADSITYATLQHKYMTYFFNFFISGVLHAITDVACGLSWHESGAIQFFCTQLLGIVLEEFVWNIYRHFTTSDYQKDEMEKTGGTNEAYRSLDSSLRTSSLHNCSAGANMITRQEPPSRPALWLRIAGILWVTLFMSWSIPVWLYPSMYRKLGDPAKGNSILPFSVFGPLFQLISLG